MNKEFQAGTEEQQRTAADNSTSASVEANPMLSAALSTREANILIASFMGYDDYKQTGTVIKDASMKFVLTYDLNWSELMPVVEKIESTIFSLCKNDSTLYPQIKWGQNMFSNHKSFWTLLEISVRDKEEYFLNINCYGIDKKEAIYKGVIEFIKWYNQQSK